MTNRAYEGKRRQRAHTAYPIGACHQVRGVGGLRIFRCSLGGLCAGGGDLRVKKETKKDVDKQTR